MSMFSEILSGGAGARRRALSRLGKQMQEDFTALGSQYMASFNPIIEQYSRERASNIDMYRTEMERSRADFARYFEQARTEYGAGMQRAISEMQTGRESTIALSRQETERQQQAARARNAFTGLGQSTFGAGRVEAIGRQGVLQEGVIREQYAGQLSALEAQRAAGMSGISAQMGQGLSNIGQAQAGGMSSLYQQYSAGIASAQQAALNNQYAMIQHGYNLQANYRGQAAQLAGAAWSPIGQMLGSFGGGFAGQAGQNLGNLFGRPVP